MIDAMLVAMLLAAPAVGLLALVAGIVFLFVRAYRWRRERELLSKRAYNTVLTAAQERGERAEDAEARVRVVEHALWVAQTSGHSIANELTAERARAAETEHDLRTAWDDRDAARAVVLRTYIAASWSAMFHAAVWLTHSFPGGTLNTHLARWRSHEQCAEALLLDLAQLGNPTAEDLVECAKGGAG
ncbi:MAG: hypothetical protein JNM74_26155 [Myxococcales bacterium]|nr:hypothetical protein [Myxococcales bacterium]